MGAYTFKRGKVPQRVSGSEPPPAIQLEPGEWSPLREDVHPHWPRVKAVLRCPKCKMESLVGENHSVSSAGVLNPSYVCPNKACDFHVQPVTLEGWDGGERAA